MSSGSWSSPVWSSPVCPSPGRPRIALGIAPPVVVLVAAFIVIASACSDQGADQGGVTTSTRPLPVGETELAPVVPVDDSRFCRTLLALDDVEAPPTLDELTATYVDLLDDVPAEIRPEFEIVLAGLVRATEGSSNDGDVAGADSEHATAAESLAEFVEVRCRGTGVSPLPPPTVPD